MVDYQVIGAVDLTLRDLLWSEMQSDTVITSILASELQITMDPPFNLVNDTEYSDVAKHRNVLGDGACHHPYRPSSVIAATRMRSSVCG